MKYRIFTDGSAVVRGKCTCNKTTCHKCNRWGGCGVYIIKPSGKEVLISKQFSCTKTGRMEIYALLLALKRIPTRTKCEVYVYSDSMYVVNSVMKRWIYSWEKFGWSGIKNVDLWQQVLEQKRKRKFMKLRVRYVKGHQKDLSNDIIFGNNVADELASYKRETGKRVKDE